MGVHFPIFHFAPRPERPRLFSAGLGRRKRKRAARRAKRAEQRQRPSAAGDEPLAAPGASGRGVCWGLGLGWGLGWWEEGRICGRDAPVSSFGGVDPFLFSGVCVCVFFGGGIVERATSQA